MPKAPPVFKRPIPRKAWRTSTQTTTERGYGWEWQKLRKRILQRDKYLCQPCKANGRITSATEVDHCIAKVNGGTDDPDNLRAICTPCHKAKTALESQDGRGRG